MGPLVTGLGQNSMLLATGPSIGSGAILLDARPLQGGSAGRGIGTYLRGLLSGFAATGRAGSVRLLVDSGRPRPLLDAGFEFAEVRHRYHGLLAAYEDAAVLGADLARLRPALFHATSFHLPGSSPVPVLATVHDLIPWTVGGMLGQRLRYGPARRLLSRCAAVIAVSESTAADVRRLARVRAGAITVVPEAAGPAFRSRPGARALVAERWGLNRPYLLFVGALDRRKDPAGLQRAWLTARRLGADVDLVLAGDPGAQAGGGIPRSVALGRVTDEELSALYSAAAAMLFPSRYEGFGLPVLEAMACGCPVVAYRNSSLPEVAGEAAVLVADGDSPALGREAAALVADPARAAARREAGLRRAAGFSWERAARETWAVYSSLLAHPG